MHFNPIYSLIAAVVMIALYRITQLAQHGQLKLGDKTGFDAPWRFWGNKSYERKYKRNKVLEKSYAHFKAPYNWYYRTFGIKYKERWFTSTWLTVFATDGYHLLQFLWLKLFYLIIANHLPLLGSNFITDSLLWSFLVTWFVLGTVLWATETILKRN
jgi:hypothetical protein